MTSRQLVPLAALIAHVLLGVFPYLASGLLAPANGVLFLMALWLALLVTGIWLWQRHPRWTPFVPVSALVLWFVVVAVGDRLLGWTA